MSAEVATLSRSWPVGSRTCTLTVPQSQPGTVLSACVEWSPDPPARMDAAEWYQYRTGRNAALAELAAALGGSAAVIDL